MSNEEWGNWIVQNYPTAQCAYLKCEEATLKMVEEFPELKRVRGLASVFEPYDLPPTKTPHWWCEAEDGTVVDPTAHQYPTYIIEYHPADESQGEPTGKCPNCGDLCYEGKYLCSDDCEKSYLNYLNSN